MPRLAHLLAAAALVLGLATAAAADTRLEVAPDSRFWLEGSTNVNRFRCRGSELSGAAVVGGLSPAELELALDALAAGEARPVAAASGQSFRLEIPIAELDCGHRGIERDLRRTLDAARHPLIVYELEEVGDLKVLAPVGQGSPRYRADVAGAITLRAERRSVATVAQGEREDDGLVFRVTGDLPVRMTDFGIAPPTVLFGLIRVHDELRIRFDLRLRAAPAQPSDQAAVARRR